MKLPRDLSGTQLSRLLEKYGYEKAHQTGSHIRLTSEIKGTAHNITIPEHSPLKIGTLNGILSEVAVYLKTDKNSLIRELFEK